MCSAARPFNKLAGVYIQALQAANCKRFRFWPVSGPSLITAQPPTCLQILSWSGKRIHAALDNTKELTDSQCRCLRPDYRLAAGPQRSAQHYHHFKAYARRL
jgi:hypothetical protein